MEPGFFLEQMERLSVQAERETDPLLKKEHQKTIRHLHKQYRRATKHRKPWFGYLRITGTFFVIFLLALWGATKLIKTYGREETMGAGWLTIIAFIVITVTMLLMLRLVSPDTYASVIGGVAKTLPKVFGKIPASSEASEKSLPETRSILELPKAIRLNDAIRPTPQVTFDVGASERPESPSAGTISDQ